MRKPRMRDLKTHLFINILCSVELLVNIFGAYLNATKIPKLLNIHLIIWNPLLHSNAHKRYTWCILDWIYYEWRFLSSIWGVHMATVTHDLFFVLKMFIITSVWSQTDLFTEVTLIFIYFWFERILFEMF